MGYINSILDRNLFIDGHTVSCEAVQCPKCNKRYEDQFNAMNIELNGFCDFCYMVEYNTVEDYKQRRLKLEDMRDGTKTFKVCPVCSMPATAEHVKELGHCSNCEEKYLEFLYKFILDKCSILV